MDTRTASTDKENFNKLLDTFEQENKDLSITEKIHILRKGVYSYRSMDIDTLYSYYLKNRSVEIIEQFEKMFKGFTYSDTTDILVAYIKELKRQADNNTI